jgi:hypothetical protein
MRTAQLKDTPMAATTAQFASHEFPLQSVEERNRIPAIPEIRAVQSSRIYGPGARIRNVSARRASPIRAVAKLFALALLFLIWLSVTASFLAQLSHWPQNKTAGHVATKAFGGGALDNSSAAFGRR